MIAPNVTSTSNNIFGIFAEFGHIFTKLKIHIHPIGLESAGKLSTYLNQYCAEVKQEVIIMALKSQWNFTFNNATKVKLDQVFLILGAVSLNEYFPRMQQLEVIDLRTFRVLVDHFPHLTSFTLRLSYDADAFSEPRRFLQKNPQLTDVKIPVSRGNYLLRHAKSVLPKLKWTVNGNENVGYMPDELDYKSS